MHVVCNFFHGYFTGIGAIIWLSLCQLTHLSLDKMAAILADNIFKCIFLNENVRILIQISLKFVPKVPMDNKSALVQIMACRLFGAKPLPKDDDPIYRRIYAALGGDELIK